jgi:hypothetical protein
VLWRFAEFAAGLFLGGVAWLSWRLRRSRMESHLALWNAEARGRSARDRAARVHAAFGVYAVVALAGVFAVVVMISAVVP